MQVIECEQGSPEWFRVRLGIPTASEFKSVLAKGEGKTRKTYMMKLLGERFTGQPADSYTNAHMERGKEMEDEARKLYAFMQDVEPRQVGFLRNGETGCSPDSLIGDDGMLEIKTRLPHLQIELLTADRMPPEHKAQIQGALWISGRQWCDFASYWPGLPLFLKRVLRDEEYVATLAIEIATFLSDLHAVQDRIIARGGSLMITGTEIFDRAGNLLSAIEAA